MNYSLNLTRAQYEQLTNAQNAVKQLLELAKPVQDEHRIDAVKFFADITSFSEMRRGLSTLGPGKLPLALFTEYVNFYLAYFSPSPEQPVTSINEWLNDQIFLTTNLPNNPGLVYIIPGLYPIWDVKSGVGSGISVTELADAMFVAKANQIEPAHRVIFTLCDKWTAFTPDIMSRVNEHFNIIGETEQIHLLQQAPDFWTAFNKHLIRRLPGSALMRAKLEAERRERELAEEVIAIQALQKGADELLAKWEEVQREDSAD